jgi:hypothetical protein
VATPLNGDSRRFDLANCVSMFASQVAPWQRTGCPVASTSPQVDWIDSHLPANPRCWAATLTPGPGLIPITVRLQSVGTPHVKDDGRAW